MTLSGLNLLDLQEEIAYLLENDEWFANIPVVTESRGDIPILISGAVQKIGTCIVVETPTASQRNGNIPDPYLDEIILAATVWEHVELNRRASGSQKKFLTTAQIAHALLLQFVPTVCAPLAPVSPLFNAVPDPVYVGVQLRYRTAGAYKYS